MNRIKDLFSRKNKDILSVYFTAGFPALNDTQRIITTLDKHGADLIEIGIPFSDPVADGPVIQKSSEKALKNGISLSLIFEQLKNIREKTQIPLILMGYINPIHKMGMERFLQRSSEIGIDGMIIPDLPLEIYKSQYKKLFSKTGISNILLITPQTPEKRVRMIDRESDGFIYMVSSYATTGAKENFSDTQKKYFRKVQSMNLKNPCLVGFGVSNNATYTSACEYASGAIIGSAFIKALEKPDPLDKKVNDFISDIRGKSSAN